MIHHLSAGVGGKTITFDGTGADNLPDVITNADGTFTAQGPSPNTVATGWKVQAHFAADTGYTASDSVIRSYNTLKHAVTLAVTAEVSCPMGTTNIIYCNPDRYFTWRSTNLRKNNSL